jgi:hypothetical protein
MLADEEVYVKLKREKCAITKKVKGLSGQTVDIQEGKNVIARTIERSSLIRVYKCKFGDIQMLLDCEDVARLGVKPQGIAMTFLRTWKVMKEKDDLS